MVIVRLKRSKKTGQVSQQYAPAHTVLIIIIIMYIYNALNDALSASRVHNTLKTILSKYIHIQNRQS